MLTQTEIVNRLRIYALKGVNKELQNGIVIPIDSGFEALSPVEETVLSMLYIDKPTKTPQEIAKMYGVSVSTIYRIRKRALLVLQCVIDDEYINYMKIGKEAKI